MTKLVKNYKLDTINNEAFEKDRLIRDFLYLVKIVASKIYNRIPMSVSKKDLISEGVIGLIDAIEKYNPEKNNKFGTYAEFRIRGAILDFLRSEDWSPRSIRDIGKNLDKTKEELSHRLNRDPLPKEIAKELGVSLEEYFKLEKRSEPFKIIRDTPEGNSEHFFSIFEALPHKNKEDPENIFDKREDALRLKRCVEKLKEKYKLVVSLYYFEDLSLKEIGNILQVTESRISQIHSEALVSLKAILKEEFDKT